MTERTASQRHLKQLLPKVKRETVEVRRDSGLRQLAYLTLRRRQLAYRRGGRAERWPVPADHHLWQHWFQDVVLDVRTDLIRMNVEKHKLS